MTKNDVEKIMEEEGLTSAHNLLEDRPDKENEVVIKMDDGYYSVYQTDEHGQMIGRPVKISDEEDAFDRFLSKLRAIKTKQYEQLLCSKDANRVLRITATKTFVSRYDFEATYHELYKSKTGEFFAVLRMDPAPGGYGEEYMYIKEVYELVIDEKGKTYSEEDLLQLVFSKGKKVTPGDGGRGSYQDWLEKF